MKLIRIAVLALLALSMLASCMTKQEKKNEKYANWYLNPPQEEDAIFAVGVSSNKNPQMAMERATSKARADISNSIKIRVSTMTKDFLEEAGAAEVSSTTQFTQVVSKQISDNVISGSGIIATHVDESTSPPKFYVLMKIDIVDVSDQIDSVLAANSAAYAKLQAKKGFDELAKELKSLKGTDY
jgi:uncharacterized protein (DUF1778 family)